jgi:hypothetical protein
MSVTDKKGKEGDQLSPADALLIQDERRCCDCSSPLVEGPHGGLSVNWYCIACGSRFNDIGPFGVCRISGQSPLRVSRVFDELLKKTKSLRPMTPREREEQAFSFAYGNLACSTNHKPTREAFRALALAHGWTEAEFDSWATGKDWKRDP